MATIVDRIFARPLAANPAAARWLPRGPLVADLYGWALTHFPEAALAVLDKAEPDWEGQCLGSIFRRRAGRDPCWLFKVAEDWPRDVLLLAPYIKAVRFGDVEFPGRMGWSAWVRAVRIAGEVF